MRFNPAASHRCQTTQWQIDANKDKWHTFPRWSPWECSTCSRRSSTLLCQLSLAAMISTFLCWDSWLSATCLSASCSSVNSSLSVFSSALRTHILALLSSWGSYVTRSLIPTLNHNRLEGQCQSIFRSLSKQFAIACQNRVKSEVLMMEGGNGRKDPGASNQLMLSCKANVLLLNSF